MNTILWIGLLLIMTGICVWAYYSLTKDEDEIQAELEKHVADRLKLTEPTDDSVTKDYVDRITREKDDDG